LADFAKLVEVFDTQNGDRFEHRTSICSNAHIDAPEAYIRTNVSLMASRTFPLHAGELS
jgi:hypothetical protein